MAVVGNIRRIGQIALPHPDPEQSIPLDQRIGFHPGRRWNAVVAVGVVYAGARAIELQPVVATLHRITHQLAQMQGRKAVGAAVAYGHGLTVLLAVKKYRLAQQLARREFACDFTGPGTDVPDVAQKCHVCSFVGRGRYGLQLLRILGNGVHQHKRKLGTSEVKKTQLRAISGG